MSPEKILDRRICVAPMMDWTDRHCRFFHRLISPHAFLYTEMIHANAIIHGDAKRHLDFSPEEKPVALQLGGIEAQALAEATRRGEEFGYAEINLNCGCPSDRVQSGEFGACLMAEPGRVAAAIAAMRAAVSIPVTVKTRLGIDDQDSYDFLRNFVRIVHEAGGCDTFILHARKAWLKGLSPKENREKPPLHWDRVHRIKAEFPQLTIITNGGFETVEDITAQFNHVNGVMIGRKAYHEPYFLAELEQEIFASPHPIPLPRGEGVSSFTSPIGRDRETQADEGILSRNEIVTRMILYMEKQKSTGTPLRRVTKHMAGLFHAQPNSKAWKHALMAAAKENSTLSLQNFLTQ